MPADSKSITLLVFILSSLASLSLTPHLATHINFNVNTMSNYGFLYALDVNYYSYGFTVAVTTNKAITFGTTYGAYSGYCGANEDATAWIFTLDGEHDKLRFLCASTYGYERIYNAHVKDNYIYVAGSMRWLPGSQYDVNYEALVAKLDPNGNLVWGKAFGNLTTSEEFYGVTVEDHIYAVGYTSTDVEVINPTPRGILVVKIDKSYGNVIWAYIYNSINYYTAVGLKATSSGGYVYILGRAVTYEGYERNIVMKINTNGDVIWAFETNPSYEDIVAGDAIYLVGSTVTKIDTNGNILWSKNYGAYFLSGYYNNGYVYLAGFMNNKPTIVKIDPSGNTVFGKQLNYNGWAYDVAVYGSMIYITGYITLTYTSQFILGITEDFSNNYVSQVSTSPQTTTTSKTTITLTRQAWSNFSQTSTMSQGERSFWSPTPIFKGAGISVPTTPTPSPSPTPSPTPTPPTSQPETPTTEQKMFIVGIVAISAFATILSLARKPVKDDQY